MNEDRFNDGVDFTNDVGAELLDRLVDGELAVDKKRELLQTLDATPGGWRACALAFLESQALGEQFSALADEVQPSAPVSLAVSDAKSSSSMTVWYAVAASALIAFGLGTFARDALMTSGVGSEAAQIAASGDPTPIETPNLQPPVHAAPLVDPDESLTFWVTDDRGERRSLTAPLVDASELDNQMGLEFPTSVSPAVRQQWEGRGYRLLSRRRYAPLYLEGGQPVVVPVEDVQIVPVKSVAL